MEFNLITMSSIIAAMTFGAAVASITSVAYRRWKKSKKSNLECNYSSVTTSAHCAVCLCNNPVLRKMLHERMERNNVKPTRSISNADEDMGQLLNSNTQLGTNFLQEDGWTNFDDATNFADLELSISNENTYDKDFIKKCRDPAFLEAQLKKIEVEYQEKMEKLEQVRANEIAKKEAQYEKIKAEVLNEAFFQ